MIVEKKQIEFDFGIYNTSYDNYKTKSRKFLTEIIRNINEFTYKGYMAPSIVIGSDSYAIDI